MSARAVRQLKLPQETDQKQADKPTTRADVFYNSIITCINEGSWLNLSIQLKTRSGSMIQS